MLIFGGLTFRNQTFTDGKKNYSIFEDCESFSLVTGIRPSNISDSYRKCGEELLNDLWLYFIKRNKWQYVRLDYNRDDQKAIQIPPARFGHAGTFVELDVNLLFKVQDQKVVFRDVAGKLLRRKYLYIYGGFSFSCTTACFDTWRYEIPFAPMAYYPFPETKAWKNYGNFW